MRSARSACWNIALLVVLALPVLAQSQDFDQDGFPDATDNCRYEANDQADTGGVAGAGPDLIGNACQCGDVDRSGGVAAADLSALRVAFAGSATSVDGQFCNVRGPAGEAPDNLGSLPSDCDITDVAVLTRALQQLAPGIEPSCRPAVPHLDITESLDGVQQTIDVAGGQLETFSAGVRYTLIVPPGALGTPTELSLTPIEALSGFPVSGAAGPFAAELGPDGLQFAVPATLEIEVPMGVPTTDLIGYSFAQGGTRPHLFPQSSSGATFSLELNHFSGFGIENASCEELIELASCRFGLSAQDCALQSLAFLVQRPNCGGPPASAEEVRDVFRFWYRGEGGVEGGDGDILSLLTPEPAFSPTQSASKLRRILSELLAFRVTIDAVPGRFGFSVGPLSPGPGFSESCSPWGSLICASIDELFIAGVEQASHRYANALTDADIQCFQSGPINAQFNDDDTVYLQLIQLTDLLIEAHLSRFLARNVFEADYNVPDLLAPKTCGVTVLVPETQRHFLEPGESLELTVAEGFGGKRYELPAPGLATMWDEADDTVATFEENRVDVLDDGVASGIPSLVNPVTGTIFYETENPVEIVSIQGATFVATCLSELIGGSSPINLPCSDSGSIAQGNFDRDGTSVVSANAAFPGFLPPVLGGLLELDFPDGPPLLMVAGESSVRIDTIDPGGSPFPGSSATTGFVETSAVVLPTEPAPIPVPAVPILIRFAARGEPNGQASSSNFNYTIAAGIDVLEFEGRVLNETIDALLVDVGEVETLSLSGSCDAATILFEAGSANAGCAHGAGLTVELDQETFDALLGPDLTFPLADHYEIIYSDNLP